MYQRKKASARLGSIPEALKIHIYLVCSQSLFIVNVQSLSKDKYKIRAYTIGPKTIILFSFYHHSGTSFINGFAAEAMTIVRQC